MSSSSPTFYDVVIVGAGAAGLAAAREIKSQGKSVLILEKSRGVGGRIATRRLGEQRFDHGAQFFTTKGESVFRQTCRDWLFTGVIKPWFGRPGQVRYCGIRSINGVAKELALGIEVRKETRVVSIEPNPRGMTLTCQNGEVFECSNALITAPAPQALELVQSSDLELEPEVISKLAEVRYERCIALLVSLEEPSGMIAPGILRLENDPHFITIADSQLKGTSSQPGVIALSSHAWARENYDRDAKELESELLEALQQRVEVEPKETYLHKWKFAHRIGETGDEIFIRSESLPLWFAGDSFGDAKVEGAFLSGYEAALSILES